MIHTQSGGCRWSPRQDCHWPGINRSHYATTFFVQLTRKLMILSAHKLWFSKHTYFFCFLSRWMSLIDWIAINNWTMNEHKHDERTETGLAAGICEAIIILSYRSLAFSDNMTDGFTFRSAITNWWLFEIPSEARIRFIFIHNCLVRSNLNRGSAASSIVTKPVNQSSTRTFLLQSHWPFWFYFLFRDLGFTAIPYSRYEFYGSTTLFRVTVSYNLLRCEFRWEQNFSFRTAWAREMTARRIVMFWFFF